MKKVIASAFILIAMVIIAACGTSIEEEKIVAEANAEKTFNEKPEEVNQQIQTIEFHLPQGFSINEKDEIPNNVILEKGDETFVLFYNPIEDKKSESVYKQTIENAKSLIVNKTFSDDERFGYLIISEIGEDRYEVTAGIGGIKATTESGVQKVAENTEILMQMVTSSIIKNNDAT